MLESDVIQANAFLTVTIGILVLFLGRRMNSSIPFLTNFSIPEAVSGGVVCSLLITAFYALSGVTIDFDLTARNILLVYFFTTIGINASLKDLFNGGKPLVILLFITIGFMVLQNLTGISVINLFGESAAVGTLTGSVSLIGGHGTAIAWAPKIQSDYGVSNAIEIGMASATFGLVLASMLGGPIAKHLIQKFKLEPSKTQPHDVGLPEEKEGRKIDAYTFLDSILAIHISIILGFTLDGFLNEMGVQLPLFVSCLFAGIILTNLIPNSLPRLTGQRWPSKSPAMALIAEVSLGTFLTMSLMSLQLWTLIDLAGPIISVLLAQVIMMLLVTRFVVFPLMGRNYDAAVICSGFCGYTLGATPTAMANMSAVTKRYGNSHMCFIIVPLVCAFFIDIVNAILIPFFLSLS